jgi:hypothetical protein
MSLSGRILATTAPFLSLQLASPAPSSVRVCVGDMYGTQRMSSHCLRYHMDVVEAWDNLRYRLLVIIHVDSTG